jgi:hypothetical protein
MSMSLVRAEHANGWFILVLNSIDKTYAYVSAKKIRKWQLNVIIKEKITRN